MILFWPCHHDRKGFKHGSEISDDARASPNVRVVALVPVDAVKLLVSIFAEKAISTATYKVVRPETRG